MTENYNFPDSEDIPKIQTETEVSFEKPEQKRLFITYNEDEWEDESTIEEVLRCINSLFGTNVQIVIAPDDFNLLSKEEVREMLEEIDGE